MPLPLSHRRTLLLVGLAGLSLAPIAAGPQAPPAGRADAGRAYLFTYFTKNGEDGLHLASSADGYRWERLNGGKSYLAPTVGKSKLMRDPCVVRGPDGTYHMVWTSGWNENNIGYASTRDFVTSRPPRISRPSPRPRSSTIPASASSTRPSSTRPPAAG